MKKIFALFLTIVMALGLFAACSIPASESSVSEPEASFTEIAVVNDSNVSFTITSAPYDDGFWGQAIKVHLENKTEKTLMFALDNVSVNGYMVTDLFAEEVSPNKKANASITIFSDDLDVNGITKITELEFTLRVYDYNDWAADALIENTYTITF